MDGQGVTLMGETRIGLTDRLNVHFNVLGYCTSVCVLFLFNQDFFCYEILAICMENVRLC